MTIFELSPEEISTLALVVSIGISKQYTESGQLGTLAILFSTIGDTLGLIQLQRLSLNAQAEQGNNGQKSNSNEASS